MPLSDRPVLTAARTPEPVATPVTIQPNTNTLRLNRGDSIVETISATVPKKCRAGQGGFLFSRKNHGSMCGILNAVQAGASSVLTTLGELGADIAFGVRNYQDFASGDPYAFPHEVSPTSVRGTTTAAISSGSAIGGGHLS